MFFIMSGLQIIFFGRGFFLDPTRGGRTIYGGIPLLMLPIFLQLYLTYPYSVPPLFFLSSKPPLSPGVALGDRGLKNLEYNPLVVRTKGLEAIRKGGSCLILPAYRP
jgi:hypothetical protein